MFSMISKEELHCSVAKNSDGSAFVAVRSQSNQTKSYALIVKNRGMTPPTVINWWVSQNDGPRKVVATLVQAEDTAADPMGRLVMVAEGGELAVMDVAPVGSILEHNRSKAVALVAGLTPPQA